MDEAEVEALGWDDSYAIAKALIRSHPEIDLAQVSLGMVYQWVIDLKGFQDDPRLANDPILSAIYQEWYEEVNST